MSFVLTKCYLEYSVFVGSTYELIKEHVKWSDIKLFLISDPTIFAWM